MPNSGKSRKAKRRARQSVEAELPEHWVPSTGQEERENNKLIRKSLRWRTDASAQDFTDVDPTELDARDLALRVTMRNMLSPDVDVANSAVRNLISMESQNQKDQIGPRQHNHLHVEVPTDNPYKDVPEDELIRAMQALAKIKDASKG